MSRPEHQPADLALLASCAAELAQAFVSLSSDIALVIDAHGVIQTVAQSPSMPALVEAGGWVGQAWVDTVSSDTRRKVEAMLSDLKATGLARRREINVRAEAAGGLPVAFTALRLGDTGPVLAVGKDLRAVSAIQQKFLDAQQDMERGYWRARQAESRYRLLFQVASDAVLTVDATNWQVLENNRVAATMLGAGRSLAGLPAVEMFGMVSRTAVHALMEGAGRTGKPAEIQVRILSNGDLAAVSATPFRVDGGLRLMLRVRLVSEAKLPGDREDNQALALLVDSNRDGVIVTDSAGVVLVVNPAFLKLLGGLAENEVRGRAVGTWLGRVDSDVSALLNGAHQQGIAHLVRSRLRLPMGQALDVDITASLLAEGEQERFGWTVRRCDPAQSTLSIWSQTWAELDEQLGERPLSELMVSARQLFESHFARAAMERCGGNRLLAARMLGLAPEALDPLLVPHESGSEAPAGGMEGLQRS